MDGRKTLPCLMVLFAFANVACGSGSKAKVENENAYGEIAVQAADPAALRTPPPEYRIGILDELEMRVAYHERLNELVTVRPDGRITLTGLGDVYVEGMTPSELDRIVTKAYSEMIHDPDVTVFVRKFGGLNIYVLGEVDKPGVIEYKPNMTLLQSVATAGGPVTGAQLNSVVLIRRDEAGKPIASRFDLSRSSLKYGKFEDTFLRPQDVVFVPRTFITDVQEFATQVYDIILPPFDIYLRYIRWYRPVR